VKVALSLLVKLAWRNLLRQKARTAAGLAAVAVGVTCIILSGGFIQDIFVQLREAIIHSQSGHIQVAPVGFLGSGSRSPEKYVIENPEREKDRIASVPGVSDVMARAYFSGLLNNGYTDFPIIGEGMEPDKEAALGTFLQIKEGRLLTDEDQYGVMVGEGVARALELRPGDSVVVLVSTTGGAINTLDFEVVGIFQSYSQEYDDRAVKVPLRAAQELLNTGSANVIVVSLQRTADTAKLAGLLRERTMWKDMEVKTWFELNQFYRSAVELYERQFGVLRIIILVMVLLGVMNTLNMTVFERVGEFGTMRALGDRSSWVTRLVIVESVMLGLIGAVLGAILGVLLALGISAIGIPMPPPPNSNLGYTAYIRIVPSVIASAFAIGVVAATLASLLPAFRVSRIHIAEALRQNV
jgi:putative ABC transport system permease protein